MIVIVSLVLFFFSAESTLGEEPEWVTNPKASCSLMELCAVGEGQGFMSAEGNALEGLAKIFQTKVDSKQIITSETESNTRDDVVSGSQSESVRTQAKITAEEVIEGAVIKKKFKGEEMVYALASLNKLKAAKIFTSKMRKIDEENKSLYLLGKRHHLSKVLKNLEVRDALHRRYLVVSDTSYPGPISLGKVLKRKNELAKNIVTILLEFKDHEASSELGKIVIKQLLGNDYRVVKNKLLKYDFVLRGDVEGTEEFMKVKGFEKHKFILNITSYDKKNRKKGSLAFSTVQTGRSLKQAYLNALPILANYIDTNLSVLNID